MRICEISVIILQSAVIFVIKYSAMKHLFFLLPAFFALSSCHFVTGSGNIISEKRVTGSFTGISAGGDFEVEWKNGPVTEVIVEADDNIMQYIETRVTGDILKIGTRDLHNFNSVHMKVYITAPVITDVSVSASADFIAKDVMKYDGGLTFRASSSGTIRAGVDAPEVENTASSSGTIKLSGKTKTHTANVSSGADIKTSDLMSENTTVTASSGASAHVHASVNLNANASSGADISYIGAANVQRTVSSGGSVEKGE